MRKPQASATTRTLVELVIVFFAAAGVIGLMQDYYWMTTPELLDTHKVQMKYFASGLACIGHLLVILRRRAIRVRD